MLRYTDLNNLKKYTDLRYNLNKNGESVESENSISDELKFVIQEVINSVSL